jgi:hypothetical protein
MIKGDSKTLQCRRDCKWLSETELRLPERRTPILSPRSKPPEEAGASVDLKVDEMLIIGSGE